MAIKHKALFLALVLISSVLTPALAATEFNYEDPVPTEITQYMAVVLSPGTPTPITFGMLYLIVLMGILLGVVFYTAIHKTKLFGSDTGLGGTAGTSVGSAVAVILTLITVKFTPFPYYLIIAVFTMLAGVVLLFSSFYSMFKGVGEEENKGLYVAFIGITALVFAWMLTSLIGYFQKLGQMYSDNPAMTAVMAGGWIVGIVCLPVGAYLLVKGKGEGGGGWGGLGGKEIKEERELAKEIRDLDMDRKELRELDELEDVDEKIAVELVAGLNNLAVMLANAVKTAAPNYEAIVKYAQGLLKLIDEEVMLTNKEIKIVEDLKKKAVKLKADAAKVEALEGHKEKIEEWLKKYEEYLVQQDARTENLEKYKEQLEIALKKYLIEIIEFISKAAKRIAGRGMVDRTAYGWLIKAAEAIRVLAGKLAGIVKNLKGLENVDVAFGQIEAQLRVLFGKEARVKLLVKNGDKVLDSLYRLFVHGSRHGGSRGKQRAFVKALNDATADIKLKKFSAYLANVKKVMVIFENVYAGLPAELAPAKKLFVEAEEVSKLGMSLKI